jgi:hypothetical protein
LMDRKKAKAYRWPNDGQREQALMEDERWKPDET